MSLLPQIGSERSYDAEVSSVCCASLLDLETTVGGFHVSAVARRRATDDLKLVRLTAPPALLRERITRREPAEWVGLPRLLDAAVTLETAIAALPGVDSVLSTEDADPRTVAARLRDGLRTG